MKINRGASTRLHQAQLEKAGVRPPLRRATPEAQVAETPAVGGTRRQIPAPRRASTTPEVTVQTGATGKPRKSSAHEPEVTVTTGTQKGSQE